MGGESIDGGKVPGQRGFHWAPQPVSQVGGHLHPGHRIETERGEGFRAVDRGLREADPGDEPLHHPLANRFGERRGFQAGRRLPGLRGRRPGTIAGADGDGSRRNRGSMAWSSPASPCSTSPMAPARSSSRLAVSAGLKMAVSSGLPSRALRASASKRARAHLDRAGGSRRVAIRAPRAARPRWPARRPDGRPSAGQPPGRSRPGGGEPAPGPRRRPPPGGPQRSARPGAAGGTPRSRHSAGGSRR